MKIVTAADKNFAPILESLLSSILPFDYEVIVFDLGGLGYGIPYQSPVSTKMFSTIPYKPRYILETLETMEEDEVLVWMDADTILKDRIDEIEQDNFDIGVTIRQEGDSNNPRRGRINAGVLFFRNRERTKEFIRHWSKEAERLKGDQWALNTLMKTELVDNLIVSEYPGIIYNNYYFEEDQSMAKILHYKTNKREHLQTTKDQEVQATAVLLNWKRPENLKKLINSIRQQTVKIDIVLWNNNPKDQQEYEVDLQINSGRNLRCWPRWTIANYGKGEYMFVIDDDLMLKDPHVIEDCINFHKEQNQDDLILGFTGVLLNSFKKYKTSKHIKALSYVKETQNVDIVKGRFMFMSKSFLLNIRLPSVELFRGDDIYVSSFSDNKMVPYFLHERFQELGGNGVNLFSDPHHFNARQLMVQTYFPKKEEPQHVPENRTTSIEKEEKKPTKEEMWAKQRHLILQQKKVDRELRRIEKQLASG